MAIMSTAASASTIHGRPREDVTPAGLARIAHSGAYQDRRAVCPPQSRPRGLRGGRVAPALTMIRVPTWAILYFARVAWTVAEKWTR